MSKYVTCKGCKQNFLLGQYWGSQPLTKAGLCHDCAPPASTCTLGERCEFERIHLFLPHKARRLRRLRLCPEHVTALDERLHAALMRLNPPPPPEAQPKEMTDDATTPV